MYSSFFYNVNSGVPQACHLVIILLINGVIITIYRTLFFIDYLKIFRIIDCLRNFVLLQNSLDSLSDWYDMNKLFFNTSKCKVMLYSEKRTIQSYKYC